jgi:hypothetical protein
VIRLTDGGRTDPQNAYLAQDACAGTVLLMSMVQLVLCSALGVIIAQGALYAGRHVVGWIRGGDIGKPIRKLIPTRNFRAAAAQPPGRGYSIAFRTVILGGFIKYAAPAGAAAIIITLGVWAVGDNLAARSARTAAAATVFDSAAALPVANVHASAEGARDSSAVASRAEPPTAAPAHGVDPYADPEFKVHRLPHPAGTPVSLTEKLVQRAEAKARNELLRQTLRDVNRSQYDCEAAERASKYLKAGLDVWGFATWQLKYFPMDGYRGATLEQCREIQTVVDPSALDLKSTVAQRNHP